MNLRRFGGRVTLRLLPAVLPGRAYDSPAPNEGAGGCRSLPHTRAGRAWPRRGWRRSCSGPARFSACGRSSPLHGRVVQRVGPPAHGRGDAGFVQRRLVVSAGMLDPPVGVVYQASARPLPLGGYRQRRRRQLGAQMVAHGPADDFAREQVHDGGRIEPALAGRDAGQISQPDLVRRRWRGFAVQQVGATGKVWWLSVVCTRRGRAMRPRTPWRRIRRSTRRRPSLLPPARNAACTRGLP